VGRNCPAKAMPFDGMVRRYLITYNVNLLPLTNDCQQRGSTDYALGVAHNTLDISATIANFSRLLQSVQPHMRPTSACARERSSMSSSFHIRSVSSELLLDKNCTSSSYVQFPFSQLLCHEHYLSQRRRIPKAHMQRRY